MTLAARTPSLQLLKEVGIFVTPRDKNEVTIRLWINLSTRTTYAVRCMSQHDPKLHVHNLRTGPRDDVFTGIPLGHGKIGQLRRCEIAAFLDLDQTLTKPVPACVGSFT